MMNKINFQSLLKMNVNKPFRTLLFAILIVLFSNHDLYLKMDSYFLEANQEARISLYNGTFEKSENIITRDRILDASIVHKGERKSIAQSLWKDQDSTITYFDFKGGEAGTFVAGVSTKERNIALSAEKFNDYLKHDGVLDMLTYRKENKLMNEDALEAYQKHVKAIFQVGGEKTDDWKTVLGYPIEFVPKENPYNKYSGEKIDVQLLLDGSPAVNQLVYADYISTAKGHSHDSSNHNHSHSNNEEHSHTSGQQLRTDKNGIIKVDLPHDGIYYLRTIHMVPLKNEGNLTHRSKWATLTFEVSHKHGLDTHTHESHDHEDGIPTWVFILGSILLVGILFLLFRKKA